MSSWTRRKARIAGDSAFRARVYAQQIASRRRRRERERAGLAPACDHVYRDGRRCWLVGPHRHGGIDSSAIAVI